MSTAHCITYPDETPFTAPRSGDFKPGDEVLVYDAVTCCYEWHVVMDVVIREGQHDTRTRIRIMGANFYFDSNIVRGHRAAHHVPPARYRKPTKELEPHKDRQLDDLRGDEWDDDLFRIGDYMPTEVYV